jgi:catechol 2,3-dioxygenase-like lactoylglutathione lyase family enzyme
MKPRPTVITLTVEDLERSLRFYRDGLGFATPGIIGQEYEHGAVVFIDLQPGVKLALWPKTSLCRDTGLPLDAPSATEFSLGHNVTSRTEVDSVMQQALGAGAVIIKAAQDTFWGGYSGYFQDPDD